MISKTLPEVDHFVPVEPTKDNLDFADFEVLDFSSYEHGQSARIKLADQLHQAMTTHGFFVIVNHGISEELIERQVDIGHTILTRTPREEKEKLRADITGKGEYPGFKPRGHWKVDGGPPDRIENFNVNRNMSLHQQPAALQPYQEEVQNMVDTIHKDILYKILRLFALALQLPDEDFFVNAHSYEKHDESWARWMEYYVDASEAQQEANGLWMGGHQDLTSISLLFSQPMSALQVRDYADQAQWKWVRHVPGAIIVNAGEIMMWWTGNYFQAAIHRVSEPPCDQKNHDRSSFFYFAVPNDEVLINTLLDESPVLRDADVKKWFKEGEAPTSKEWVNERIRKTGQKTLWKKGEDGKNSEQEKIGKVTTTWFR